MHERPITSEDSEEVSGEIGSELEHLKRKDGTEASAEEKREARLTVYRRLLKGKEEELASIETGLPEERESLKVRIDKQKDRNYQNGMDADMVERLAKATLKNFEEEFARKTEDLRSLIDEIKENIDDLERGETSH